MAPLANGSQEALHACMHAHVQVEREGHKGLGHVNDGLGHLPNKQVKARPPPLIKRNAALSLSSFLNIFNLSLFLFSFASLSCKWTKALSH